MSSPPILIMGVSGSGKSTIGARLAAALDVRFIDGDALHPDSNRRKMAAGVALSDADREPWLTAVAAALAAGATVVACSALRRRYRDRLRSSAPCLRLIYLRGTKDLLAERVAARHHEFMPTSLLESQLETLEPPAPDERPIVADIASSPEAIVCLALRALKERV